MKLISSAKKDTEQEIVFEGLTNTNISKTSLKTDLNKVPSKKRLKKGSLIKILVVIELITVAFGGFLFYQYIQEKQKSQDPLNSLSEQSKQIKEAVGKLIKIDPQDNPTIATIQDVSSLKKENAEFYKDAQNGDVLLIYSKKAIIYNKSLNIIINVAPVVSNQDSLVTTTPPQTTTPSKR